MLFGLAVKDDIIRLDHTLNKSIFDKIRSQRYDGPVIRRELQVRASCMNLVKVHETLIHLLREGRNYKGFDGAVTAQYR